MDAHEQAHVSPEVDEHGHPIGEDHGHDHAPDDLGLVGAFRFCPSCGHPVLAMDDFGVTPETQLAHGTLEALEEIRCAKCFLPWKSCPCGIRH